MHVYATDFDGTLTNRPLDDTLRAAIRTWQKEGNLFGIVSGRPYLSIYTTLKDYRIPFDFLIANNGAVITDGEKTPLCINAFTPAAVSGLMARLATGHHDYVRVDDPDTYYEFRSVPSCVLADDGSSVILDGITVRQVTEITVNYPDHETTLTETGAVEEMLGHTVKALLNGPTGVDYVAGGVHKASGIRALVRCLGVHPEVIYTTGDSFNDLAMLTCPDFEGYAVENALPEVKAAVGRTVAAPIDILLGKLKSATASDTPNG